MTNVGAFKRDMGLCDQIRRAAVSIMANIAEGFERSGRREFRQFLVIAKASSAEFQSHLYVALDAGYIGESEFKAIFARASEVGRILGALRIAVEGGARAKPKP